MVTTRFISDSKSWKQPRVCANRGEFYKNTTVAGTNSLRAENRKYFTLGNAAQAALRVVYSGFYITSTNVETACGNDQTVEVGLEIIGSPNVTKLFTFSGAATGTILNGQARYVSDWLYPSAFGLTEFPAGMTFYIRDRRDVTSGQTFPRCPSTANMTGEGTFLSNGASASQVNAIGAMTTPASGSTINRCFGPICVEGIAVNTHDIAVMGLGDSLVEGPNDTNQPNGSDGSNGGGWLQRALINCGGRSVPFLQMAYAGTQAVQFVASFAKRREYWPFVTHVIEDFGTNDFADGSRTAAQVYSDRQVIWAAMKASGSIRRIAVLPIFQRTTSTDSFATVVNQTPRAGYAATSGTFRDPMNANLAAALSAGLIHEILDVASVGQDATSTDKWAAGTTTDGTHPSPTTCAAQAAYAAPRIAAWV